LVLSYQQFTTHNDDAAIFVKASDLENLTASLSVLRPCNVRLVPLPSEGTDEQSGLAALKTSMYQRLYEWIQRHEAEYSRLIVTDARDLIFQGDPFEMITKPGLYVTTELASRPMLLKEGTGINLPWVSCVAGEKDANALANSDPPAVVLNSGLSAGTTSAVMLWLEHLDNSIKRHRKSGSACMDQGHHTWVVYQELRHRIPVYIVNASDSIACNALFDFLGYPAVWLQQDSMGHFLNRQGAKYAVMHQQDRLPSVDNITRRPFSPHEGGMSGATSLGRAAHWYTAPTILPTHAAVWVTFCARTPSGECNVEVLQRALNSFQASTAYLAFAIVILGVDDKRTPMSIATSRPDLVKYVHLLRGGASSEKDVWKLARGWLATHQRRAAKGAKQQRHGIRRILWPAFDTLLYTSFDCVFQDDPFTRMRSRSRLKLSKGLFWQLLDVNEFIRSGTPAASPLVRGNSSSADVLDATQAIRSVECKGFTKAHRQAHQQEERAATLRAAIAGYHYELDPLGRALHCGNELRPYVAVLGIAAATTVSSEASALRSAVISRYPFVHGDNPHTFLYCKSNVYPSSLYTFGECKKEVLQIKQEFADSALGCAAWREWRRQVDDWPAWKQVVGTWGTAASDPNQDCAALGPWMWPLPG
jgi:hypothetical protein